MRSLGQVCLDGRWSVDGEPLKAPFREERVAERSRLYITTMSVWDDASL